MTAEHGVMCPFKGMRSCQLADRLTLGAPAVRGNKTVWTVGSSMEEASSRQQITPSNKAFRGRSWTLLLNDCFPSRGATINSLSAPLTLSFHLIYIPLSLYPPNLCLLFWFDLLSFIFFLSHPILLLCGYAPETAPRLLCCKTRLDDCVNYSRGGISSTCVSDRRLHSFSMPG